MNPHVLTYGRAAWDYRRTLLEDIAAMRQAPPFDYSDVLYLVPNSGAVRTLHGMFLDALEAVHGSSGCMPPMFGTMSGFISRAAASAPGPPVIDRTTRSIVIDMLTRREAAGLEGHGFAPDTLGGAVSRALALRLEELESSGVFGRLGKTAAEGLPGLLRAVGVAYRDWLNKHGLRDPHALTGSYMPAASDFSRYGRVVLDGFYDAAPAELGLMLALKEHPACDFVIEAPGLGSDVSKMAGSPFAATLELFGRLGMEPPDGTRDGEEHAPAVMGTLFGGVTPRAAFGYANEHNPLGDRVRVVEAEDEESEARFIAAEIKRAYRNGRLERLSDAAVFLPSPDDYMQALGSVFRDAGIPYSYRGGVRITGYAPVRDALGLISLSAGGHRFSGIRAALSSPFVTFAPGPEAVGIFSHYARAEGVATGAQGFRRLAGLLDETAPGSERPDLQSRAAGSLVTLLGLTEGFDNRKRTLHDWAGMALGLLEGAGLPDTLSPHEATRPELVSAYSMFTDLIGDIRSASASLTQPVGYNEFVRLLKSEAAGLRLKPEDSGTDSVRIISRLQLGTEPHTMMFAAGLLENRMPASPAPDPVMPERTAEELGLPGARALRDRDARALLSIVLSGAEAVLTRPRTCRSRPASPSPFLRGLRPFTGEATLAGPASFRDAIGPADLLEAAGYASSACSPDVLADALGGLPDAPQGIARAAASLRMEYAPLPAPGHAPERFTVTEIEEYINCGWRYYQSRVLGLGSLDDPEEDFAPHMAGSAVHRIMHRFHDTFDKQVTPGNSAEALGLLRDIADREFAGLPVTLRNVELKKRFTEDVAPVFIDSEAARCGSGFRTVAAEMKLSMTLDDGTVITGKIDRLDVSPEGDFEVADYKTGGYPTRRDELFQLPVYAKMVMCEGSLSAGHPGGLRPVSFVYYSLKGGGMRDVVLYASDDPDDSSKRRTDDLEAFAEEAMQKLREAVKAIRAGEFEKYHKSRHFCDSYCEFRPSCPNPGFNRQEGDED